MSPLTVTDPNPSHPLTEYDRTQLQDDNGNYCCRICPSSTSESASEHITPDDDPIILHRENPLIPGQAIYHDQDCLLRHLSRAYAQNHLGTRVRTIIDGEFREEIWFSGHENRPNPEHHATVTHVALWERDTAEKTPYKYLLSKALENNRGYSRSSDTGYGTGYYTTVRKIEEQSDRVAEHNPLTYLEYPVETLTPATYEEYLIPVAVTGDEVVEG